MDDGGWRVKVEVVVEGGNGVVEGEGFREGFAARVEAGGESEKSREKGGGVQHGGEGDMRGCCVEQSGRNRTEPFIFWYITEQGM